jgi:hypothetical protein
VPFGGTLLFGGALLFVGP